MARGREPCWRATRSAPTSTSCWKTCAAPPKWWLVRCSICCTTAPEQARPSASALHSNGGDAQQVGCPRLAERHAGDCDDRLTGLGETFSPHHLTGGRGHFAHVFHIFDVHGVHAPGQREAASYFDVG